MLDIPWWCFGVAFALGLSVWKNWRWESGLLAGYVFLVLAETVLIRKPFSGPHFQPNLFWSWRAWEKQSDQVITNVIMFIPIGIVTGWLWKWRGIWFAFGLSCLVEILQLVTERGLCEFDDVIHNVFGAIVGAGVVIIVRSMINDAGLRKGRGE